MAAAAGGRILREVPPSASAFFRSPAAERYPLGAPASDLPSGTMRTLLLLLVTVAQPTPAPAQSRYTGPIVDVNVRASPPSDARIKAFDENRVTHAVMFGEDSAIAVWAQRWRGRIIHSVSLPCASPDCFRSGPTFPDTGQLRAKLMSGRVRAIGELMQQFAGMRPDDPRLEPYFALAEEYDVPVGIHLSLAPPFVTGINPLYRTSLGRPDLIEDVIAKHQKLRVYIAHAGYPRLEEVIAVLYMYPNVSVDISAIALARFTPPGVFHEYMRRLVELGFADRIMFGSDVQDPAATRETVDAIQNATFLSLEQKRAVLCDNARKFFRIDDLRCN